MKRVIALSIVIILLLTGCSSALSPHYIVTLNDVEYGYSDMNTLLNLIDEEQGFMNSLLVMINEARDKNRVEHNDLIRLLEQKYGEASQKRDDYQRVYDKLNNRWQQKKREYSEATYIWEYLLANGYSEAAAAGILGNVMTEVGGNTLKIHPMIYNKAKTHYGIIQWSSIYSDVWGKTLEEQCEFLINNIDKEFKMFGSNYKTGFTLDKFKEMNDPAKAARAFMVIVERCGEGSSSARQSNAIDAYNYFVS